MNILRKISNQLLRLRLRPIKVFCFHIVSDTFDSETMWECDWIQTDCFKSFIDNKIKQGYHFISLAEAHKHISKDWLRYRKYAVLTFDDGSTTLFDLMPWLAIRKIPLTLFVNPAFLSGDFRPDKPMALMRQEELRSFVEQYWPLVSLASHSYKHDDVSQLSAEMFYKDVAVCEDYLKSFPGKIPYYAYPCGRFTMQTHEILRRENLIPVLVDGQDNFNEDCLIHRILP